MPDLLATSIEYGGYISPIKLAIFIALFLAWLPLVRWVYDDAESVETKQTFWAGTVLATAAAATIIWLLVPVFAVGMLIYIIAVATVSVSYIMHRDSIVLEHDRILTLNHVKTLFETKEKQVETHESFIFITANNNQVPAPEPRTQDFFGYKAAYDLFVDAVWRRASDIVFVPTHEDCDVVYYIDGAGLKQPVMQKTKMENLVRFLKNLADLDPEEKRKPQKGNFTINYNKETYEWTLTTSGSTAGEQITLKKLTAGNIVKLANINFEAKQLEKVKNIRELKQGLFIVSGTKQSGVTSTFYALLGNHDPFIFSINTLEKRPAAKLLNITQDTFTLSDTSTTTYAKKLQSITRMGSDIIGVGECEDTETAQMACQAAKEGKIVYVQLNAESTIEALGKWMKLVGNKNLALETLIGISNQRLLRKLCDKCKQAYNPNQELLRKFNIPTERANVLYRPGKVIYNKHGKSSPCENCQETGFVGRMAIFELIMFNNEIREVVKQSKSLSEVSTHFRNSGMLYLQEQALEKVIEGTTSINEMVRIFSKQKK